MFGFHLIGEISGFPKIRHKLNHNYAPNLNAATEGMAASSGQSSIALCITFNLQSLCHNLKGRDVWTDINKLLIKTSGGENYGKCCGHTYFLQTSEELIHVVVHNHPLNVCRLLWVSRLQGPTVEHGSGTQPTEPSLLVPPVPLLQMQAEMSAARKPEY